VFLLDEPLSNLDAKLRLTMRTEIARLHRRLGTTMIYVTHDQIEAMTLGQRIVVMKDGVIQQIDTPMALYERPANVFVATFLGSPKMNLLWGPLIDDGGMLRLRIAEGVELALAPPPAVRARLQAHFGSTLTVGLRPEHLRLSSGDTPQSLRAHVEAVEPVGNEAFINLGCGGCDLVVRVPPKRLPKPGDVVNLDYEAQHMHYFAPDSGVRIEADEAV
jgi:multiple sugar transport system ATP-binding protein